MSLFKRTHASLRWLFISIRSLIEWVSILYVSPLSFSRMGTGNWKLSGCLNGNQIEGSCIKPQWYKWTQCKYENDKGNFWKQENRPREKEGCFIIAWLGAQIGLQIRDAKFREWRDRDGCMCRCRPFVSCAHHSFSFSFPSLLSPSQPHMSVSTMLTAKDNSHLHTQTHLIFTLRTFSEHSGNHDGRHNILLWCSHFDSILSLLSAFVTVITLKRAPANHSSGQNT